MFWSIPPDGARAFGLVLLSLSLMPLTAVVVCVSLMFRCSRDVCSLIAGRTREPEPDDGGQKTVLVTGVGMAKGLTLARAFHLAGHRVIGADFETTLTPCPGRFSRSLAAFYPLSAAEAPTSASGSVHRCESRCQSRSPSTSARGHVEQLVDMVRREEVDVWVSCSGVVTAIEDADAKAAIEQQTACKCVQLDTTTTSTLHDKNLFIREMERLHLPVPESYQVTSPDQLLSLLARLENKQRKRKYLLKPVGVDDLYRNRLPLLPAARQSDTEALVRLLPVSETRPWILQQFVEGGHEYCTHALVVGGEVRCFVACPSLDLLMHYEALPPESRLCRDMLRFTRDYLARSGGAAVTGHLSFDFMTEGEHEEKLYAIECNPRAHTAVVLFAQSGQESDAMVRAYLSAADDSSRFRASTETEPLCPPAGSKSRYWLGHDIVSLLAHPAWHLFCGKTSLTRFGSHVEAFVEHLLWWKEGTFELWDPMPAFVLYHVYWPIVILSAWLHGKRWSRANVSTNKIFQS